jgi:osmotically-inducible protein OsmY
MNALVSDLEKSVTEALQSDPRTSDAVVEVTFNSGILKLSGSVDSKLTKEAIEEIARAQGQYPVISELRVQ